MIDCPMVDLDLWLRNGYNVFFISDTHFHHPNIIKYCGRPFKDVEAMNKALIENWNRVVRKEDYVFCLGDFCLGSKEQIIEIGKQLNGVKILIMGNHCRGTKKTYEEAGFSKVCKNGLDVYCSEIGNIHLTHYPMSPDLMAIGAINIHGHIHSKAIFDEDSPKHWCVCAEATDYTPIEYKELIELFRKNLFNK